MIGIEVQNDFHEMSDMIDRLKEIPEERSAVFKQSLNSLNNRKQRFGLWTLFILGIFVI